MLNDSEINKNIGELKQYMGKWRGKYLRNLRLYYYSMNVNLDTIKEGSVVGYWNMYNSDYTSSINENVIQSAIDAVVSQLASKNAIPFCDTVNGTFNQQQLAKQLERYFASKYDEQNVTTTVTDAFRDACIFGVGYVYIDAENKKVKKALPWQVFFLPSELTYDKPTRVYYERKDYFYKEKYVKYGEYYDILNNVKAIVVNDSIISVASFTANTLPILPIHYVNPVIGKDSTSIVDILYGIQMKLDDLYSTIGEAINKNPAQVFMLPQGSGIKTTALNNRIGQILTYKPIEGVNNPVQAWNPDFIANQYFEAVQTLKNDAYELVGASKLSAIGKKDAGVDSGRAMKTLQDIESERFEVQHKSVIRMYSDIARACIRLFNPKDRIFPSDINRLPFTWGDAQKLYDKMKIQFTSMSMLSKDPTQRAQEIDMLVQRGAIPASRAPLFYEMPDTESAYSYANNAINAVLTVIEQAIENEDYTIPAFIPLPMLMSEIVSTQLSLKGVQNEENEVALVRLEKLYKEAMKMDQAMKQKQSKDMQNADQQNFDIQLQRQVQTIYQTTLAQAQAQAQSQAQINTNNIHGE